MDNKNQTMKKAGDFLLQILKDKCKSLGITTTRTKADMYLRLMEKDPTDRWMLDVEEQDNDVHTFDEASGATLSETTPVQCDPRELELAKQQAELAERELALARREMELLCEVQQRSHLSEDRPSRTSMMSVSARPKTEVLAIVDLLNPFHGNGDSFEGWVKQLRLLRTTYELDENEVKILIGKRLKGRAGEWFHSKSEYLQMNLEDLLDQIKMMFFHRPSKVALRKKFEERLWKKSKSFSEYFHEKMILANRVPIDPEDMVDYLIDRIPDMSFRDQARIHEFDSAASLRKAFDKVMLRGKMDSSTTSKQRRKAKHQAQRGRKRDSDVQRCPKRKMSFLWCSNTSSRRLPDEG